MSDPVLRALVDLRDRQIQKARIQFNNRLSALDRAADNGSGSGQRKIIERWLDVFIELEKQLDKDIAKTVETIPVFEQMIQVKGIGPLLAAKILSMIDIERANTVSALWKYSGYGVGYYWKCGNEIVAPQTGMKFEGKKENKVKVRVSPDPEPDWELVEVRDRALSGWLIPYNKRLKTTLYLLGSSFLKSNSPYRQIYDNKRHLFEQTMDRTDGHNHQDAMRRMIKIFLSHLWERWRLAEGLEIRKAYVLEQLGHETVYAPEDFGWPEVLSD